MIATYGGRTLLKSFGAWLAMGGVTFILLHSCAGSPRAAEREAVSLSDAQQQMEISRRLLDEQNTGPQTRAAQQKILEVLDDVIAQTQRQESNSQGAGSGPPSQQAAGQSAGQVAGQGTPGGSSSGGFRGTDTPADPKAVASAPGPQSPWSQLRNKERDPVYNAIKEKFPARYQQLIEQYYKSFQDEDAGGGRRR